MSLAFIVCIVFMALAFDFINGFHDAANSIATIVTTRVLSPAYAVVWAAFFNFIAFAFFETKVANTLGKGLIDPSIIDPTVIFAALAGAIFWNLFTWYYGIPSSSSHALVGGMVGSAVTKSGLSPLKAAGIFKTVSAIVVSPLLGMFLGWFLMKLVQRLMVRYTPIKVDHWFRKLQFVSAAFYSLGHGGNDAQKTMGIIAVLLYSTGHLGGEFHVPLWVVLICHLAMGLGTLMGGWRIVRTMGSKITKLKPVGGFCAETAGAITLFIASHSGIPVSTTHTITGSIVGVGSVKTINSVRWGVTTRILWAWVFTIPASAVVASFTYWVAAKF